MDEMMLASIANVKRNAPKVYPIFFFLFMGRITFHEKRLFSRIVIKSEKGSRVKERNLASCLMSLGRGRGVDGSRFA